MRLDALIAEGGDQTVIVEREGLAAVGGADELTPEAASAAAARRAKMPRMTKSATKPPPKVPTCKAKNRVTER